MNVICTIKEVQRYLSVSQAKASRMIQFLRSVYDREKPKPIYMHEFIDYYEIKTN